MNDRLATIVVAVATAVLSLVLGCSRSPDRLVVAAASDLTQALPELAAAFQAETGTEVAPTFGASKLLATQISQGAPFDLLLSANAAFVDELVAGGHCDAATRAVYAHGHLAMWVRDGEPPTDLAALADPRWVRIAIANPVTAPYGAAAREALERSGALAVVAARIVQGENVRQTLQLAESGNAEVAVVARSLVIGARGRWTPVPSSQHTPIVQVLAVCGRRDGDGPPGRASARAFARFITSAPGQAILARWGLATDAP